MATVENFLSIALGIVREPTATPAVIAGEAVDPEIATLVANIESGASITPDALRRFFPTRYNERDIQGAVACLQDWAAERGATFEYVTAEETVGGRIMRALQEVLGKEGDRELRAADLLLIQHRLEAEYARMMEEVGATKGEIAALLTRMAGTLNLQESPSLRLALAEQLKTDLAQELTVIIDRFKILIAAVQAEIETSSSAPLATATTAPSPS